MYELEPRNIEHGVISPASHSVSTCIPNFLLSSTSLKPVALAPRFSRPRPARQARLSPPSNTVSPAPGAKGLLALPVSILYLIVSFIARPCTGSRFYSRCTRRPVYSTRRPVYKSTLTAFATTHIYLLLALQYHIDLPPDFLRREVKPNEKELPPKACCKVDPKEATTCIKKNKYYKGSYTLEQLESSTGARILREPRPELASISSWIQSFPEPYPFHNRPMSSDRLGDIY